MCLAIPGQLVELLGDAGPFRDGMVDFAGTRRRVNLACTPEAVAGDYVLVHAGIAIAVVQEDEARRTLEALAQLELIDEADVANESDERDERDETHETERTDETAGPETHEVRG